MEALRSSLANHLLWWVVGAAALGLLLPGAANALIRLAPIILGLMIAGLGITVSLPDLRRGLLRPKLVALGVGTQLISTPLLAFAIWKATDLGERWTGLAVQAVAPSEITSPLIVQLSGGAISDAVAVLGMSTIIAPFTMPFLLGLILGRSVPISAVAMVRSLLLTVALPLLAGSALYSGLGRVRWMREAGPSVSAAMVVLLVFVVVGSAASTATVSSLWDLAAMVVGALLLLVVAFSAGWLAARAFRLGPTETRTIVFTTGMREFGVASAVTLTFFGPDAALFPTVYGTAMMVVSVWLASWTKRRARAKPST